MRLAGTARQYSKKAIPHAMTIASQIGRERSPRWPYQAKVMKMLETKSMPIGTRYAVMMPPRHASKSGIAGAVDDHKRPGFAGAPHSEGERSVELLHLPRQTMLHQHVHERIRIHLLHVEDAIAAPRAGDHHRGTDHRGHARCIADRLVAGFGIGVLMIADVVEV